MIFSYFEIYFSVFKKSNSLLSDFECLEKCLEFLRNLGETRMPFEATIMPSKSETERKVALHKTFSLVL